jgi:hypothetical protein
VVTELLTPKSFAGLKVFKAGEREPNRNILIYGDSGVGKTRLAGSADAVPEMRSVLCIDVEGGSETLKHTYPNVDTVRVERWSEVQDVYDELFAGNHKYRTVIVDSLSETQKFNMYGIMRKVLESNSEREEFVPSMREWGINLEQMRKFVRAFRDLPLNTIFTCLMKSEKDNKTGMLIKEPSLSGKLCKEVSAFLDIVVFMYKKEMTDADNNTSQAHLLLTEATDTTTAKDRTGKLPQVIIEPTMAEIMKYINEPVNA